MKSKVAFKNIFAGFLRTLFFIFYVSLLGSVLLLLRPFGRMRRGHAPPVSDNAAGVPDSIPEGLDYFRPDLKTTAATAAIFHKATGLNDKTTPPHSEDR